MRKTLAGLLLLAASLALGGNNSGWTNAGGSLTTQAKSLGVSAVAVSDPFAGRAPGAGDIYVSQSGSDANNCIPVASGGTGPCSKTISTATLNKLSAGKYLWLLDAGTYTLPATMPNIGGSGDADSTRINIAGYPGVTTGAVISIPQGGINWYGTSFNYWTLRSVSVQYVEAGFFIGEDTGVNGKNAGHINFVDVAFSTTNTTVDNDNVGAIIAFWSNGDAAGADYLNVIRCSFVGAGDIRSLAHGNNTAGIIIFRVHHLQILGSTFTELVAPIYYKHNHNQTLAANVAINIGNNIIKKGYRWTAFHVNLAHIYNNVFWDTVETDFNDADGVQGGKDNIVNNNTYYITGLNLKDDVSGDSAGSLRNYYHDNILAGAATTNDNGNGAQSNLDQQNTSDHNMYSGAGAVISRNSSTYTVSAYMAAFSGREANSDQGTITFAGGTTPSISTPSDFGLVSGSKGYGTGTGGANVGVNTSSLRTAN